MKRKYLIIILQAAVSIGVFAWIATHVGLEGSVAAIAAIPTMVAVVATAGAGLAFFTGAFRWGWLLRNFGIVLSTWRLVSYYLMGLFFSLFLPTSVGGDAFRMYAVARATDKRAAVVFATLQERILGLCAAMAMTLVVMPVAASQFPREILIWLVPFALAATAGLALVLYPPWALTILTALSRMLARPAGAAPRPRTGRFMRYLDKAMISLRDLLRTRPSNIILMLVLGALPLVITASIFRFILGSMGVDAPITSLMFIIPLMWIVRLLPISLGGLGVGEGAFVVLAKFIGIDADKAFAVALAVLAMQIAWSLVGGVLLLRSGLKKAIAYANRT